MRARLALVVSSRNFASLFWVSVQATGNTVEAVHLQTSFVLGIGKGSVIVGILRSTADGHIVGLVNGDTEICLVRIVVFASTPGVCRTQGY